MAYFKRGALIERINSTAKSNGTTTLTADSITFQQFTGANAHTVVLPDATTMIVGQHFYILNRVDGNVSASILTIKTNDGAILAYLAAGVERDFRLTSKATTNGTWDISVGEDDYASPLKITAGSTPDAKLYFFSNTVFTDDGTSKSTPPLKSNVPTFNAGWIDFQAQTFSGSFSVAFPSSTIGYFRRVGFTLLTTGQMTVLFSAEAATFGALANPGSLFVKGGIPVGWVDLECTHASGKFKTAGSSSDVIENAVSGTSRVFKFGSGGGGGGSGDGELMSSISDCMRTRWVDSPFARIGYSIFSEDGSTKVSAATASYDIVNDAYVFSAASQYVTSVQLLDSVFVAAALPAAIGEVIAHWLPGAVDTAAVYEISKNGGSTWQTITMERVGTTEVFRGIDYLTGTDTMDLRLRVTSSTSSVSLTGFAVLYDYEGSYSGEIIPIERFNLPASTDTYQFTLTKFVPHPDLTVAICEATGQTFQYGADGFSISGQVVSFPSGTFVMPAASTLTFRQFGNSAAFDNTDQNASNIAAHESRLDAVGKITDGMVDLSSKIAVPYTTIVNRAQIPNLAADLSVNMGVNRIMTQQVYQLQNEFGASGEPVWGVVNDTLGQIRFVGDVTSWNNQYGVRPAFNSIGSFVEVTFYGTGLNILTLIHDTQSGFNVFVDGTSIGTVGVVIASTVLSSRGYSPNNVVNIVSNLTAGLHTVRIVSTNTNTSICGFEILNESSSIKVNPGTYIDGAKAKTLLAQAVSNYNSGFESGTLGTRGGCVLTYIKSNGTVAKAVTPTDATPLYLASVNHSNEDPIRTYHWREFGCGRGDDFSTLSVSPSARAFSLDDGTTTLVGSANVSKSGSTETLRVGSGGTAFVTLTFVGTGADIVRVDSASGTLDNYNLIVDGTSVGNLGTTASTNKRVTKLCSGLSFGTHTIKIERTVYVNSDLGIESFIVYGPKAPALPTGAKALGQYYVMSDYVASSSAAVGVPAVGVMRKFNSRENVYVGTWAIGIDASAITNFDCFFPNAPTNTVNNLSCVTATGYVEYTFWGVGLEFGTFLNAAAYNMTFLIDGVALSAYSTSLTQPGTGLTLSTAGVLTGTSSTSGRGRIRINGLTYVKHTLRITQNSTSAGALFADTFDIITPIHSPKSNLVADLQNTLPVGSQSIGDLRILTKASNKPLVWAVATGVSSSPTVTSTAAVPVPDLSLTVTTAKEALEISYNMNVNNSSSTEFTATHISVDGKPASSARISRNAITYYSIHSEEIIVPVAPGTHKVDIYWFVSAGTGTSQSTNRYLKVKEI